MKYIKIILVSLLLFSTVTLVPNRTEASALIDAYIKVNKVTKNSNGTISVNYTMKKDFKTSLGYNLYQSLKLSYSMNSAYNLTPVSKSVNSKKGTYTLVLPAPKPNYLGTQQVYIKWGSQGRTESKRVGTVYNVPDTSIKRDNYTVTKADATGGFLVMTALPYATLKLVFKGSSATVQHVAKKGVGIASGVVGFNLAVGVFKQMPTLTTGQVYYTERQIKTDGYVYTKLLIFANKATYDEFKNSGYTKTKLAIYQTSNKTLIKY